MARELREAISAIERNYELVAHGDASAPVSAMRDPTKGSMKEKMFKGRQRNETTKMVLGTAIGTGLAATIHPASLFISALAFTKGSLHKVKLINGNTYWTSLHYARRLKKGKNISQADVENNKYWLNEMLQTLHDAQRINSHNMGELRKKITGKKI